MKMSMTGQMRMEQRMKLAPRMIQSMEVLQLPLLALQEKIETELSSNPVLEQVPTTDEDGVNSADTEDTDPSDPAEKELVVKDDSDNLEDFQRLFRLSREHIELLCPDTPMLRLGKANGIGSPRFGIEPLYAGHIPLAIFQRCFRQLAVVQMDERLDVAR